MRFDRITKNMKGGIEACMSTLFPDMRHDTKNNNNNKIPSLTYSTLSALGFFSTPSRSHPLTSLTISLFDPISLFGVLVGIDDTHQDRGNRPVSPSKVVRSRPSWTVTININNTSFIVLAVIFNFDTTLIWYLHKYTIVVFCSLNTICCCVLTECCMKK